MTDEYRPDLDEVRRLLKDSEVTLKRLEQNRKKMDMFHGVSRFLLVGWLLVIGLLAVLISELIQDQKWADFVSSLGPEAAGAALTFLAIDYWWRRTEQDRDWVVKVYESAVRSHELKKRAVAVIEKFDAASESGKIFLRDDLREVLRDFMKQSAEDEMLLAGRKKPKDSNARKRWQFWK